MADAALSLAELIRLRRAELAELEAILEDRRADQRDWVDQTESTLGARRHCKAVKARIAAGKTGASRVGRRHLLSPVALAEELESVSRRPRRPEPDEPAESSPRSVADELAAELGMRAIGGRR